MDQLVGEVVNAIERGDRQFLGRVLHPYVHWTENGAKTRGRSKVLARLADHPVTDRPVSYELRDGQVYRWTIETRTGEVAGS